MVVDDELNKKELAWLLQRLTDAGVKLTSLSDLTMHVENRSEVSDAVLVRCLPVLREMWTAGAAIQSLRRGTCRPEVIDAAIRYFRTLGVISHDRCLQCEERSSLFPEEDTSHARKSQRKARELVDTGWYMSSEKPPVRDSVLAYREGFPSPELLSAYRDTVVGDGIAFFLEENASSGLFEAVADLLLDDTSGCKRAGLPAALVKCDRLRGPDLLMKVMNDPDIGGWAMRELAKLEYEPARPYFEKFAEHPLSWVRDVAKKVLLKLDRKQGRKPPRKPVTLPQVLPEEDRIKAAQLLAPEGEPPTDLNPKFTQFAIGTVARSEGMDGCGVTVGLKGLKERMRRLAYTFDGDLASSESDLLQEMLEAEAEGWNAYIVKIALESGALEEVWFHYFKEDYSAIQISAWGSPEFVRQLRPVLDRRRRKT